MDAVVYVIISAAYLQEAFKRLKDGKRQDGCRALLIASGYLALGLLKSMDIIAISQA